MKKRPVGRKGFTLIEIVISTAILTGILAMVYMIYGSGKDLYETKIYQTDMQAQGRLAMDGMTRELRLATRTSTQNPSPNAVIPSSPNNKQIHFYLPRMANGTAVLDTDGDLEWDTNNMIRYQYVPGQKELRRNEGGNPVVLARNVTDVQFFDTGIDPSLGLQELKIILSLTRTTPRQRVINLNLTSIVRLRN
ncbi:MAG: prepilin-type N-terminal cleavage/methylation domain-containing protein [Candidatus Omnitrophota bacterium]